ncbi:MAG: hypothetical protein CL893_03045 [Dehalococcoidia bacterium]|nr:hypothetical protein [Dehalococcoidia bacterium]|tara:strand:+ start:2227 stop:3114 length:888 start_codon:yes stop_codon:yes gene_type:complete
MKTINITASRHAVFYSPLIALVSEGFLENEGLQSEYHIPNPGINVYEKISNGEIDFAQSAVSQSWNFIEKNIPSSIKHFALINSYDGFFINSKNPGEFNWEELYKYPFYFVRGGQPEAMLKYALDKKNIDIRKINLITKDPLDTHEMYNRFSIESSGFFHEQGSYPHQLELEGHGKIVASIGEIIGPVAFSTLCADEKLINSDLGKKISNAFKKSKKWVQNSEPMVVAKSVHSFFKDFDINSISNAISDYQNLGTWNSGIKIGDIEYKKALEVFKFSNLISKNHSKNDVVLYSGE